MKLQSNANISQKEEQLEISKIQTELSKYRVNNYYGAELIGNDAARAHCRLRDAAELPVEGEIAGSKSRVSIIIVSTMTSHPAP